MSLQVACPHCKKLCAVDTKMVGVALACPSCRQQFIFEFGAEKAAERPFIAKSTVIAKSTALKAWLDIGGASSAGRVRDRNEDSFLILHQAWFSQGKLQEIALLVVADGMGGYEAGDLASEIAIKSMGNTLIPLLGSALSGQFKDASAPQLTDTILFAMVEANRTVYRKGQSKPSCKGMGATAAVVLIWDKQVLIGHVGDCRVYHQRSGRLSQVTTDQTLVARMVELGQLTPDEARDHPARNEIAQALGKRFEIEPASYKLTLASGDWLVIACDGLHAHIDEEALQKEIDASPPSASLLSARLVDLADHGGGTDNCTVVAVHVA